MCVSTDYPTLGPEHRFSAILFIEKEGFMPLFEAVNLKERFDIAIMSTKGMSVIASRDWSMSGDTGYPAACRSRLRQVRLLDRRDAQA